MAEQRSAEPAALSREGVEEREEERPGEELELEDESDLPAAPALQRQALLPALRAWVYLCGHGGTPSETTPEAVQWLRGCWERGDDNIPLDLVHDLGLLLLEGRGFAFASARDLGDWSEEERPLRLSYEDRVLGRWMLDPSVNEAHIAIAGLAKDAQQAAVAHALSLALGSRLRGSRLLCPGNPAHLRSLGPEILAMAESLPARFAGWGAREGAEPPDEAWIAWARAQREAALERLDDGRLFSAEDLWELAHIEELPRESTRQALREVHRVVARIGAVNPGSARNLRSKAQEVPVEDKDADSYPAGGFDALSTRGRFENLVRTEVVYVGEGMAETGGIDLFDVRFAEGELLFYTRDDSPLLDQRRELNAVIERPADLRYKHPELPAQTLVLIDALILRLQADSVLVFGPNGSTVTLLWLSESRDDRAAAEEERGLMAITLAAEIAHRRVVLDLVTRRIDLPARGLVVFSSSPAPEDIPARAWVVVGDVCWWVDGERYDMRTPNGQRALTDTLLRLVYT